MTVTVVKELKNITIMYISALFPLPWCTFGRPPFLKSPAFGEDDYRVCMAFGVIDKAEDIPCPVDSNG